MGSWQFADTIGIFLGFCFYLATFPSWRATTAAPAIPTAIFLILAYLAPGSYADDRYSHVPAYPSQTVLYRRSGKAVSIASSSTSDQMADSYLDYVHAFKTFRRLRNTDIQACRGEIIYGSFGTSTLREINRFLASACSAPIRNRNGAQKAR
jgi:hypothetical protein